jgi:hypothetical protein
MGEKDSDSRGKNISNFKVGQSFAQFQYGMRLDFAQRKV